MPCSARSKAKEMERQLSETHKNWPEIEQKYYMRTFKRLPVTLVRGKGSKVWDIDGKEYLDFFGGLAVNSLGHCHPVVVKALTKQAKTLIHTTNLYYTIPQLKLAELLVTHSCFNRVFFTNSGTESTEGAVKLARRYGKLKLDGAYEVITAYESFHGRTLAMTAATGQKKFHDPYTPIPDGFPNVEYNNVKALETAISKRTCAIMVEPIQGEGGVNVTSDTYLKEVRALCDAKGILLILDEIQTGIGRTGKLFAYEHANIEPDIIALAKGLGSGVPIGAILAKESASVFVPGDHGGTFGGNPLVCAVGYEVLNYIIENDILSHVERVGKYLRNQLEKLKTKYSCISGVRGNGLLLALVLSGDISEEVVAACLKQGLLLNNVKPNAIRFMPSLIVTEREIDKGLAILEDVLKRR